MHPAKFSLLLTSCLALMACDPAEDLDAPSERLDELSEPDELGVWPPRAPAPSTSAVGVQLAPPSAAIPEQAPVGIVDKVKAAEAEHLIGWVRWAVSQPYDGPIVDETGEDCAMGQEGDFWYLAGTFGGAVSRACEVPAGKTLVLPLVNRWWMAAPEYYPTPEDVEAVKPYVLDFFAQDRADTCGLTLRVDGHDVRDDLADYDDDFYVLVDEVFEVDLQWDVGWTAGGAMPAIGDGHYAVITPLPPGDHVIELGGEICGPYPFSTAATYQLHVGPA